MAYVDIRCIANTGLQTVITASCCSIALGRSLRVKYSALQWKSSRSQRWHGYLPAFLKLTSHTTKTRVTSVHRPCFAYTTVKFHLQLPPNKEGVYCDSKCGPLPLGLNTDSNCFRAVVKWGLSCSPMAVATAVLFSLRLLGSVVLSTYFCVEARL